MTLTQFLLLREVRLYLVAVVGVEQNNIRHALSQSFAEVGETQKLARPILLLKQQVHFTLALLFVLVI